MSDLIVIVYAKPEPAVMNVCRLLLASRARRGYVEMKATPSSTPSRSKTITTRWPDEALLGDQFAMPAQN
jgi:hypothetical protein